ncbi:glycosyltransferase [Providencia rettgeri]|nr:glycosyltransferase [Providencia rettgeri]ELR5160342.1 glycosyltransferase [Providencia rettgeri]ELR5209862.1 glycosyltransferase [Providencia rettgeri]ELR5249628.1 glycosyltransferase [Providencia rettgeri]MCB4826235.1 glycosyltransferase [Providencia rettgeri]MCG5386263.1 glycosyltransferase [Providencia rettgeri]
MRNLSIIVPVYNVEQYIYQCIDSLLNQTLNNIEIIIVNDGSTDSSMKIVESFIDDRIIVINKQNGGLSSARNIGMQHATGSYIAFLDSDDWVDKNAYKILYETAIKHSSDIVSCGYFMAYPDKFIEVPSTPIININFLIRPEFIKNIKVSAWDKIYKRELFVKSNITYPLGLYYEDTPTTIPLLFSANTVTIISEPLIYYRQREGSITKENKFNIKNFDVFKGVDLIYSFAINNRINSNRLTHSIDYIYLKKCFIDTFLRVNRHNLTEKYASYIKKELKNRKISIFNKLLTKKEQAFILFAYLLPPKLISILIKLLHRK